MNQDEKLAHVMATLTEEDDLRDDEQELIGDMLEVELENRPRLSASQLLKIGEAILAAWWSGTHG